MSRRWGRRAPPRDGARSGCSGRAGGRRRRRDWIAAGGRSTPGAGARPLRPIARERRWSSHRARARSLPCCSRGRRRPAGAVVPRAKPARGGPGPAASCARAGAQRRGEARNVRGRSDDRRACAAGWNARQSAPAAGWAASTGRPREAATVPSRAGRAAGWAGARPWQRCSSRPPGRHGDKPGCIRRSRSTNR